MSLRWEIWPSLAHLAHEQAHLSSLQDLVTTDSCLDSELQFFVKNLPSNLFSISLWKKPDATARSSLGPLSHIEGLEVVACADRGRSLSDRTR